MLRLGQAQASAFVLHGGQATDQEAYAGAVYRLDLAEVENDVPVLLEYQDIDVSRAFYYGIAAALFSMLGLYLRRLRG